MFRFPVCVLQLPYRHSKSFLYRCKTSVVPSGVRLQYNVNMRGNSYDPFFFLLRTCDCVRIYRDEKCCWCMSFVYESKNNCVLKWELWLKGYTHVYTLLDKHTVIIQFPLNIIWTRHNNNSIRVRLFRVLRSTLSVFVCCAKFCILLKITLVLVYDATYALRRVQIFRHIISVFSLMPTNR